MKKKMFIIVAFMFLLTGCGKQNESAFDMNTTVTNEVINSETADTEEEMQTADDTEETAADKAKAEISEKNEAVQAEAIESSSEEELAMMETDATNRIPGEDPEYGHFIRHNENYVDTVSSSYVPMDSYYSYEIPDGYVESVIDGSIVYAKENETEADRHSLYVYTESIGGVNKEDVLANYDLTIKETFGKDCVSEEEEHSGMTFNHYLYDRNDNGYHMYANIYFYADENALIYVEFYDSVSSYDDKVLKDFMDSIKKAE